MAEAAEAPATEKTTEPTPSSEPAAAEGQPQESGASAAAAEAAPAESKEAAAPPKVILHQFPRPPNGKHGPNLSVFCLKMETFLRMANIPYEVKTAAVKEGPKHKLPFIRFEGQTVCDTGFIIKFLRDRFKLTMDDHLTEEQRALGHAIVRMVEESTYWTGLYRRWQEKPEDMPLMFQERVALKDKLGFKMATKSIQQSLHGQGTGRHKPAEVAEIAAADLRALSTFLGDKPFFHGDQPTSTDASTFALLAQMVYSMPDSSQEKLIKEELKNLEEFCGRMRKQFWEDWESLYVSPYPPKQPKIKSQASKKEKKGKKADAEEKPAPAAEEKAEEKKEEAKEDKPAEETAAEKPAEAAAEGGEGEEKKE